MCAHQLHIFRQQSGAVTQTVPANPATMLVAEQVFAIRVVHQTQSFHDLNQTLSTIHFVCVVQLLL
jgi:hypothetical protein